MHHEGDTTTTVSLALWLMRLVWDGMRVWVGIGLSENILELINVPSIWIVEQACVPQQLVTLTREVGHRSRW